MLRDFLQYRRAEKVKRREVTEKAAIAKAFNDRYAYRLPHGNDNAWMCPDCNAVHGPVRRSVWVGIIYPACCGRSENERWSEGIRVS